jgi:DNA polymerase sigma
VQPPGINITTSFFAAADLIVFIQHWVLRRKLNNFRTGGLPRFQAVH